MGERERAPLYCADVRAPHCLWLSGVDQSIDWSVTDVVSLVQKWNHRTRTCICMKYYTPIRYTVNYLCVQYNACKKHLQQDAHKRCICGAAGALHVQPLRGHVAHVWSCKWLSKQIVNSSTKYKILQVVIKTKQSDAVLSWSCLNTAVATPASVSRSMLHEEQSLAMRLLHGMVLQTICHH